MSDPQSAVRVLEAIHELRRTREFILKIDTALQHVYGVTTRELLQQVSPKKPTQTTQQALDFSLFYFSQNTTQSNIYRLLIDGATFADRNGFSAVWLPERHFHPFGGPYPNPSVLAAALALKTKRIRLRAGSVVLPLHHPVRVVEDWSVIDNLSRGRVDMAFVSGWNPDDFLLAPQNFDNRKQVLAENIGTLTKLWRGESATFPNGQGTDATVSTYPRPIQPELPVWITCTGSPEGFIEAGRLGHNILTALLFQSLDELADKIAAYRSARAEAGFDPNTGRVALMLHTFVGQDESEIDRVAKPPFLAYLESSVELWRRNNIQLESLDNRERRRVLEYAYERYRRTASLIGTLDECRTMAQRILDIGVTEIASLIDFGVEDDLVLESLQTLNTLRREFSTASNVQPSSEKSPIPPGQGTASQTVSQPTSSSPRLRLFCLPYAGGTPAIFNGWSNNLPDHVEVCPLEIPPTCNTFTELLPILLSKLQPHLRTPFALYGHSVGGLIAFELARTLRETLQIEPVHLFIASQHAPQLPFPYPPPETFMTQEGLQMLKALTGIQIPDRVSENEALLKRLLRPILPSIELQSDTYTYLSQPPLSCPISVFGGTEDPVLHREHLAAWQIHTTNEFAVQMLPEGHIFSPNGQKQMLQKMTDACARFHSAT